MYHACMHTSMYVFHLAKMVCLVPEVTKLVVVIFNCLNICLDAIILSCINYNHDIIIIVFLYIMLSAHKTNMYGNKLF